MIKTVTLTANEVMAVELTGGCHVSVENRGTGIIYASKSANVVAGADGVTAIDSGNAKILRNVAQYRNNDDNKSYDYYGKIYLLSDSDTKAEIQTANDLNFFSRKNSAKGGETYDDTEIKNEIADLQNSKVDKVIGKGLSTNDYTTEEKEKLAALENYDDTMIKSDIANKVDNDIFVAENLIHYPYNNDTATSGGITFTDNEDGSITLTGSVTKANTNYNYKLNPNEYTKLEIGQTYILNNCGNLDDDCYLRLFYKADNGTETYLASTKSGSYTFVATETINEVRIWITANCDDTTKEFNNTIKPMLEVGSVAHAYQPYSLSRKAMRDDINTLMALLT